MMERTHEARDEGTRLLTVRATAEQLGICERTLFTLTRSGELRPVRIGRAVRYSTRELERFIEARTEAAA